MSTIRNAMLSRRFSAATIVLLYVIFAILWIVVSSYLLTIAIPAPLLLGAIELTNGVVFVTASSILLYLLFRVRGADKMPDSTWQPIGAGRLLLIFAALALVVPLIGFVIASVNGPHIEREAYANLEAIARLKADQIENWLDERYGDSKSLYDETEFAGLIDRMLRQGQQKKLSVFVTSRFQRMLTDYRYSKIALLDIGGHPLYWAGEEVTAVPVRAGLLQQTLASKQVQRSDIYRDEVGHIHMEWLVPLVVTEPQGERVAAFVLMRVTAQRFIFPLIQTWPTASASGETLLVRRDGESIIFINELRHRQNTALRLTLSLGDSERPAVVAIQAGKPGTVQGKDYRGVVVLAAYRPVKGTNWYLVAKVDRAEVAEPLQDLVRWVSLIALAAIAAVSLMVLQLWRQQQRASRLEMRARSLAAIEESERRYRAVTESANDGIIIADGAGHIVGWNPAAERMFGYTEAEITGLLLITLMPERFRAKHMESWARLAAGGKPRLMGQIVELAGLRKGGEEFPLELSLAQWQTAAGQFFSASIRDITGRREAESRIRRLTQLYAALSQCDEAIVRCSSEAELFPRICHAAVQFGGMKMAWISMLDETGRMVRPVASYGEGTEYLNEIRISVVIGEPRGRGPTGSAIRENQPQWCQDFLHDPHTEPWHESGVRYGWGASAALPLTCDGRVVGAFTLYSGTANAFDDDARKLLLEMAADISFALDGFAHEAKRKQAELELAESERHFRSLFENMLEGYAYCKMLFRDGVAVDFVYLEVNRAFERLTGLGDVVGRRVSEVIPGLHAANPELFEIYGRVALSGQPERFEMYIAALEKWFAISVYCPLREYFVVTFDDITARKQAEQVLAESEQRFRSLVEQSLAGIYIIQDGKFAYVNPRFAEIFGYPSAAELIDIEPARLVAEQDQALVAENMRRRLSGEVQNINYVFTGVRKDGNHFDVGVHGARVVYRGRPAIIGLIQDVSEKKRAEEQIQRYIRQLEESFMHIIEVATTLVELRDPYTTGHEKRVAQIAVAIGREMGLDEKQLEGLRVGGYIHDIGKIIVPTEILSKPGRLQPAEYELIKGHPQAGYSILKNVEFPWPVADIAYQHHERMDGSGYPQGLKGDEILLEARIMAVADVVEAVSSHRPYRPAIGLADALAEIEHGSGKLYDPVVVAACLRLFRDKGLKLPV